MNLQQRIYKFLQGRVATCLALFFISVSICAIIAGSFKEMEAYQLSLFGMTYLSSFVFLIEYVARVFSAPAEHPEYRPFKARMRYIFSFYGFVDFMAILPCVLTYLYWDTDIAHIVILPYIFIIFKLIRHSKSFRVIGKALVSVKEELITSYTACLIIISFSAILMYFIEHAAQPEVFENIGDGFWWSIVAFTTTGYGDIYPITPLGKILGSVISLVGIAMITIPTGIISSSFINTIQKREKDDKNR